LLLLFLSSLLSSSSSSSSLNQSIIPANECLRKQLIENMGNCISYAPDGIPECQRCGKVGHKEWHELSPLEKKREWVVLSPKEKYTLLCVSCSRVYEEEDTKFVKERQYYSKAKTQLYPKVMHKERLKRLKSDEKWDGTASFYASYRPPSTISHLIEEVEEGIGNMVRKGTDFVGQLTKGNSAKSSNGSGGVIEEEDESALDGEDEGPSSSSSNVKNVKKDDQQTSLDALHEDFEVLLVQEDTLTDEEGFEVHDHD
jgi:hypothetical protein